MKKEFDPGGLRKVLKDSGDPQESYRSIHVAGTKGKGSICTFVSSILEEAGYSVGLFTSPHLTDITERIKINDKNISREHFAQVLKETEKYLTPEAKSEFTYFEVLTLAAILYFSLRKVDFAVFEAGMGGRLDATNVIDAEVSIISPISYDHIQVLGGSLEEIAGEKAGIIKSGTYCVSSPQDESVLRVVSDKCREKGASLSIVGRDITYDVVDPGIEGSEFNIHAEQNYEGCYTKMPGIFQAANAAAAVGACERIKDEKTLSRDVIKRGLEKAFIPGRLEVLARNPMVVIDGAQNVASAENLKYSVEQLFKYDRLILLLGLSGDKDIRGVCESLVPASDEVVLTRASGRRAADPLLVRGYIRNRRVKITSDIKEGLGAALHMAKPGDLILATGSFYVIGEVREFVLKGMTDQ